MDERLSHDTAHITKTVSSCFNQLGHINRIKHLLDRQTLLLLIKSFVFYLAILLLNFVVKHLED